MTHIRDITKVDFEWNVQKLAFLRAPENWISAKCHRSSCFLVIKETQDDETSRTKGVYKWGLSLSDAKDKLEIQLHMIAFDLGKQIAIHVSSTLAECLALRWTKWPLGFGRLRINICWNS